VSSLIDEVEAKVARARSDFSRSERVISSAREDLESHQRWLDHYRSAWTNELTLALRSLKQRQVSSTCKRLTLGLILVPSFVVFGIFRGAIWTLLCARDLLAGGLWRFSNCARLREHICKLGGSFRDKRVADKQGQRFSNPIGRSLALRVDATVPDLVHSRPFGWGLGVIVVALITASAVRATMPSMSAAVTERAAPKAPTSTQPAEMLSTTMPKTAPKILRPTPSTSFSGFRILRATSAEPLSLPAMTVGEMMLIANPLDPAPTETKATTAGPDAEEPLTATPKVKVEKDVTRTPKLKPKPKRKLARQEPQQQQQQEHPWWSRFPWLGAR
jgi:hypothetical protein